MWPRTDNNAGLVPGQRGHGTVESQGRLVTTTRMRPSGPSVRTRIPRRVREIPRSRVVPPTRSPEIRIVPTAVGRAGRCRLSRPRAASGWRPSSDRIRWQELSANAPPIATNLEDVGGIEADGEAHDGGRLSRTSLNQREPLGQARTELSPASKLECGTSTTGDQVDPIDLARPEHCLGPGAGGGATAGDAEVQPADEAGVAGIQPVSALVRLDRAGSIAQQAKPILLEQPEPALGGSALSRQRR